MEIIVSNNDISYMVKDYYKKYYDIKSCKVKITAENIKDKLKEIDLFHREDMYYNVLFKANITGWILDSMGNSYQYQETLNEKGVKDIVKSYLSKEYEVKDLKFGYKLVNNPDGPTLLIRFSHAKADIVLKPKTTYKIK